MPKQLWGQVLLPIVYSALLSTVCSKWCSVEGNENRGSLLIGKMDSFLAIGSCLSPHPNVRCYWKALQTRGTGENMKIINMFPYKKKKIDVLRYYGITQLIHLSLVFVSELSAYSTSWFIAWSKVIPQLFSLCIKRNVVCVSSVQYMGCTYALRSDLIPIIWNDKCCVGFLLALIGLNQKWDIYWQRGWN